MESSADLRGPSHAHEPCPTVGSSPKVSRESPSVSAQIISHAAGRTPSLPSPLLPVRNRTATFGMTSWDLNPDLTVLETAVLPLN